MIMAGAARSLLQGWSGVGTLRQRHDCSFVSETTKLREGGEICVAARARAPFILVLVLVQTRKQFRECVACVSALI